jgi:DnaJ-class molecular chaperone
VRVSVPRIGELYAKVRIKPHPLFERKGDDLYIEVPVTLAEAVLGAEIEVPTLDGKVTMRVPPETQNGQVFRLKGLGMPKKQGGRGDELVRIKVVLPTKLSPREREALAETLRRLKQENPRAPLGCR